MTEDDEGLDGRWDELREAIELGEYSQAAALLDELAEELGDDAPEVMYERAVLAWEQLGPEDAAPLLDELLRADPDHADGHYARAHLCEQADDAEGMVHHFLTVLRLDRVLADELELGTREDLDFIEGVAEAVLATVPLEFRERLHNVPIVLEAQPHAELVREGFDPRALGLFEGLELSRANDPSVAPTRIVLFYANLLADFPDREILAEEIEITILHEIGHFFGLDEDDVERLGLQ